MGFMNSMKSTLNEDFNESYTENGAFGYRTTGRHLLDLNFKVASLRKADAETIISGFDKAFSEDHIHALKWLFYLRDAREGLGERRSFRIIMSHMANVEPEISKVLIGLIAEYGRYDDLLSLVGTECEKNALEVIKNQLMKDMEAKKVNKPVSLLAKWMPSCNATSYKTKENATVVRKYLGFTERQYRKILSELREYIDVVERKMSAKKWGEINYEAVPSKANLVYNNAFLKNDEERRREYLDKLEKGEAKINSSTNFPHDIVHSYLKGRSYYRSNIKEDKALEALWKALPDTVQGDGNTLVVRDGSGSMMCSVDPNSSITALEVATALAIYFSERCSGEFKDNFITFSSRPELIDLSACSSLAEKIRRCYAENDCSNTDIEKTFDLILQTAINTNMKQEDMPKNILIISDMEFDQATYSYGWGGSASTVNETLFKTIGRKFEKAGYQLPRLVFWNVNSRTGTIPVKENALGVALVSGFSVNVAKMVLSGELDPYKCLIEQLDTERYAPIEAAIKDLK
jgi:hypothetical protein